MLWPPGVCLMVMVDMAPGHHGSHHAPHHHVVEWIALKHLSKGIVAAEELAENVEGISEGKVGESVDYVLFTELMSAMSSVPPSSIGS